MKKTICLIFLSAALQAANAQLHVEPGTVLYIQENSIVAATGDVWSEGELAGPGTLLLNGSRTQHIFSANLRPIPGLSIDNPSHVRLSGDLIIRDALHFLEGKLIAENYSLVLGSAAVVAGTGRRSYVMTAGTGQLKKMMNADTISYTLPIGSTDAFTPIVVRSGRPYTQGAFIAAAVYANAHPERPPGARDFLHHYWSISKNGIGGYTTATVSYQPEFTSGREAGLQVFTRVDDRWVAEGTPANTKAHTITTTLRSDKADLYAMSRENSETATSGEDISGIYPNPTASVATLAFYTNSEETITLILSDVSGKILQRREIPVKQGGHRCTLDLQALPSGVYQVWLQSKSFNKSYRITRL